MSTPLPLQAKEKTAIFSKQIQMSVKYLDISMEDGNSRPQRAVPKQPKVSVPPSYHRTVSPRSCPSGAGILVGVGLQ